MTPSNGTTRRRLPTSPFSYDDADGGARADFTDGDRVTHDKHGLGRVIRVDDASCVVSFGEDTYRRITLNDPRLTKL